MQNKMKTLLAGFAIPALLSQVYAQDAKIYFQENFRNYADAAPGVSAADISVGNDPIWAVAADLKIRSKKDVNVFDKDIAVPGLKKFDLLFQFRFMSTKAPVIAKPEIKDKDGKITQKAVEGVPAVTSFFDVVLNAKGGKKTLIRFESDKVSSGKFSASYDFIADWKWEEAQIKADGKNIIVYVTKDREFKKLLEFPYADTLESVNYAATANKQFCISSIVFSDPIPVKTYPVAKHFADFKSVRQAIEKPAAARSVTVQPGSGIRMSPGKNENTMTFIWSNGKNEAMPITIGGDSRGAVVPVAGLAKGAKLELDDATILIGKNGAFARQFVRPNLQRFQSSYDAEPQYIDIIRDWNNLPAASAHPLDIDFVAKADGKVDVYLDGSFIKTIANEGATLSGVKFDFAPDAKYMVKPNRYANVDSSRFTVIDLATNPRAKAFVDAKISLKDGLQTINGIPLDVAKPIDSADVAICKQGKGNWALEVEEYHGRTPLDGFPSAIHYRLPAAPYGKAYVLCAIDSDASKDKVLTTRVGHYMHNGSGANMLADNVITIEDGKIPENFKEVGTVELKGKKVPLYLVEIPLALGNIVDIPARRGWIDFEFTGKGWVNTEQLDNTMKPDPNSDSAFNIFAVTLEKAPVIMDMVQTAPGNIFTEDEKVKKTTVTVKAENPASKGTVSWEALDVDGKQVFKGSKEFSLAKTGDTTAIDIDFGKTPVGFYDLIIKISDAKGNVLFTHPGRFAILGKDERKAGKFESPYATWWFNAHGSPGDMHLGGPIMQKAGIRKASWTEPTKEAAEKYNITNTGNIMAPGMREFDAEKGKFKPAKIKVQDPNDPKKMIDKEISGEENFKRQVREAIAKRPNADHILIWHESAPGYGIPEEVLNMPLNDDQKKQIENDKRLAAYINEAGRLIREVNPKLKIQVGNTSASIGSVVRPLRAGADPQYYDYIGIETPSQVIPPERLSEVGLQGMVLSKEIANQLGKGKKNIELNGCWEFTYRCERDMGEQQQAEWYVRDVIISLANDFFLISPGILFDCNNGYYNGLWGGSGIIQRAPYVYPKRAYVAYAALTNVLDRVKFSRQIPTGSTTVYAVEFKRADGKFATALWSARGEVTFTIDNPSSKAQITEMYGKKFDLDGKTITVKAGTSPVYVLTDKALGNISITGRDFAKDMKLAEKAKVGAPFDDITKVELKPDMSIESTHTGFLPIIKPSDFTIKQVKDEEKGDCIEVTLDLSKDKYKSKYITEYTTVRLKEPMPVPGNPEVVGIWVKGNSNWGQIRFEIEDANGEVFKNISTGREWGCDVMDWPGNLAVNFDGWGYVYQPLFQTKLVNDHSPGPYSEQWVSEGGDKKIDLPIKIRAITVGMNRHKLDLLDFKNSAPSIRIKDAGGIEK